MAKHKSTFPFKFKHNLDVDVTFSAEIDLPDNPAVVARFNDPVAQHFAIGKDMLLKLCTAHDGMIESRIKEAQALHDAGQQAAAMAKVKDIEQMEVLAKTQIDQKTADIKARAAEFINGWWAGEVTKDKNLKNFKINVAITATGKITLAVAGITAGIAVAVASHGGAVPIAAAAVGGSVSLASKSYAALAAAFADTDSAFLKLTAAYTKAAMELEKTHIKAQKPDKSRTDKIKAFFATAPTKDLEEKLNVYKVKMREAETKLDSYGKELTKLMAKQEELKTASTKDAVWKAKAEKTDAKVKYLMQKLDFLNKKTDAGKAAAAKAAKLIEDAKAGKVDGMGAGALDTFKAGVTVAVDNLDTFGDIAQLVS